MILQKMLGRLRGVQVDCEWGESVSLIASTFPSTLKAHLLVLGDKGAITKTRRYRKGSLKSARLDETGARTARLTSVRVAIPQLDLLAKVRGHAKVASVDERSQRRAERVTSDPEGDRRGILPSLRHLLCDVTKTPGDLTCGAGESQSAWLRSSGGLELDSVSP